MIGLTEVELLDIADALPPDPDRPDRLPQLNLWTNPEEIRHDLARTVVTTLQSLAMRARFTTPHALLSDAVALLNVRSQLRQRYRAGADRALANTDVFLEMSRAYDVRGLRAFAADMRANWEEAVRQVEGRPDAEEQSVALITIHAAKGLEWPIVIPINMTGSPKGESGLMHDRRSGRFSIPVFGVEPADYAGIKGWNVDGARSRAGSALVRRRHARSRSPGPPATFLRPEGWGLREHRRFRHALRSRRSIPRRSATQCLCRERRRKTGRQEINLRTEASEIVRSQRNIEWRQPSRSEATGSVEVEREPIFRSAESTEEAVETPVISVAGGATRGTILHKLMEEVLNGETQDGVDALEARALELMAQLSVAPSDRASEGISATELAQTVVRTLSIPEIAQLRPRLVPEHTVYGSQVDGDSEIIVSGIADAVAYDDEGRIETIVDWKSDVEIDAERVDCLPPPARRLSRTNGRAIGAIGDDDCRKNYGRLNIYDRVTSIMTCRA